MKSVLWRGGIDGGGEWYTFDISPDGTGTYDITNATLEVIIPGGPEGMVYVPPGSPLFPDYNSVLVAEFTADKIAAYTDLDANGDPILSSRVDFVTGLNGAEGAAIDPLTGDFFFSTFGSSDDRVIAVRGFAAPPADVDGDGFTVSDGDCDDNDNTVFPKAPELCDGKDNDCDGEIDEDGGPTFYFDFDEDGFGDPTISTQACTAPQGYVEDNTDCDDNDNRRFPGGGLEITISYSGDFVVPFGNNVNVSATIVDADSNPVADGLDVTFKLDNGSSFTTTVQTGSGSGDAAATFTGVPTGVYTVTISFDGDDCLLADSQTEVTLAVYDPSAGFVTGGGWFISPAEAYADDLTATGKANFGFVSRYKKGATVPTGQTEFVFKAADLNFHSSNYEWLVVTGSNYAKFKGTGTINGAGSYKFMIWAGDSAPDTFRIRIWEEVGSIETDKYDNGTDQSIGGGNIKVHSK